MPETALIAGHGPGFCEAFARSLGDEGYSVALFARSEEYLDKFEATLQTEGYEAKAVPVDMRDPGAVHRAVDKVKDVLGPIEVLAHTASFHENPTSPIDYDQFKKSWEVYTGSALTCFQAVVPDLQETQGTVLFFGAAPSIGNIAYKSAKAGNKALSHALAEEYSDERIQVTHLVVAGSILNPDTYERNDKIIQKEHIDPESLADTCIHLVRQPPRCATLELNVHTLDRLVE